MSRSGSRAFLLVITLLSTVFVIWNTLDEFWVLQTWGSVLLVVLTWLLSPYLVALIGLVTKNAAYRRVSIVISLLQMVLFLTYALNGSSSQREMGAQHMHLVLIPPLLFFFTVLSFAAFYLLDLFHRAVTSLRLRSGRCNGGLATEVDEDQKAPE